MPQRHRVGSRRRAALLRRDVLDLHEQLGIVRRSAIGPWTMAAGPDGGTLADRPVPDRLTSLRPTFLLAPPDGARLALGLVHARLDRLPLGADVRPALELPRTCLEHRFSTDIRLGRAKFTGRADDIALGGSA